MARKKKAARNRGKNPAGMAAEAEGSAGRAPRSHGQGAPFDIRRGQENGAHPRGARPGQEASPPHGTAQKIIEILRRAAAFMGRIGSARDDTSGASSSSAGDDTSDASSIPGNGGVEALVGQRSRRQLPGHQDNHPPPRCPARGQAILYTFGRLDMNKRCSADKEAPRWFPPAPIYPVDKDEDPYQNERRYEEFCQARMKLPLGYELCTVCFFEEPWRHGNAVVRSRNMISHFSCHNTPGVKCGEQLCTVRFRSCKHQQLYTSYCTSIWETKPELRYDRFCRGMV